jgi:hypothetical protein
MLTYMLTYADACGGAGSVAGSRAAQQNNFSSSFSMLPIPSGGPLAEQVDKLKHGRLTKLQHDSLI